MGQTLRDLFGHRSKDLYKAQDQWTGALQKKIYKFTNDDLKSALEDYLKYREDHKVKVKKTREERDIKPTGEKCKTIGGSIKEARYILEEVAPDKVMDGVMIAGIEWIEYPAIFGFGAASVCQGTCARGGFSPGRNCMPSRTESFFA